MGAVTPPRRWAPTRLCAALGVLLLTVATPLATPTARADENARIAELSATLGDGHSERERIAAITALARLNSKTALRPLVAALHDGSATVRGIAAVGLGKLGHRAALPALRAAQADGDALVQKRAAEAVAQICVANNLPLPTAPGAASAAGATAGFGNKPRAVAPRPDLFVVIKSSTDDSPGSHDKSARKVHADAMRAVMASELTTASLVTLAASDARRYGLDPRQLDLSIVRLDLRQAGGYVEVDCQIRLAISTKSGKMLSFVSGGAKVQVPRKGYDARYLGQMRKDAVENAVRGVMAKLIDQLRRSLSA
ncbi:MAG: HEAT repeat domain-containing protein [Kofleriaceae bacterium]